MQNLNSDQLSAQLAAIVDSSDDAIIGKNLDGIITSWNKSAERIFGYTADEVIGKSITIIIPQERLDEEFVIIGKIKSGQRVDHFETVRRRKDGKDIDISVTVSPIRNSEGIIIGASKIARDVGNIREAERLTAYLAAIVDSSADAIISKDLSGNITSWNKGAEQIFGYTAAEIVDNHINMLIPEEKRDEELAILSKVKSGNRIEHFETVRQTKNLGLIDVSLTVSPIFGKNGSIIGVSMIARDITEHKRIEQEARNANAKKDEFLANMSHELRTPMNAVIGLTNILGMSPSLSAKEKDYIRILKQSAENLMVLINNLLDFAKLEAGNIELENIEFDLKEVVEKSMAPVKIKAEEKGLDIQLSFQGTLNRYYIGDPFRIQQVLSNLFSNAIKFTDHGRIMMTVKEADRNDTHCKVCFVITDTGTGIPADKISSIFEKFIQADASTTRKYGGTGLGLSICKAFVEEMGGHIFAESRLGLGSTFTVELPLGKSGKPEPLSSTPNSERPRKNVLIVDDYEANHIVVSCLLEQFGYEFDIAESGVAALHNFGECHYDIILMDIQMHDMDGFECTRRMREIEISNNFPRTAIVAMTAHISDKDRQKCFDAGMDDFISKPFEVAVLKNVLDKAIARPADTL